MKKNDTFQEKLNSEGIEVNNQAGMRQIVQYFMYEQPGISKKEHAAIEQDHNGDIISLDEGTDNSCKDEEVFQLEEQSDKTKIEGKDT
ncbi:hypothetical protein BSL78_13722 [Apostichopus japonicus]|uniref:Uncharacterized protein n=1 Tax=Stichopus japonicus TaxID=307972 RepID=A0A2G8KMY4_STIJA|nr:hypothetical protein BSL78_13722 [Apostichopus japonicus]